MSIQDLKIEMQKLTKQEQAFLMHFLVELMADEGESFSKEWKDELDRREQAFRAGKSIGRPARDVLEEYLKR